MKHVYIFTRPRDLLLFVNGRFYQAMQNSFPEYRWKKVSHCCLRNLTHFCEVEDQSGAEPRGARDGEQTQSQRKDSYYSTGNTIIYWPEAKCKIQQCSRRVKSF